MDDRIRRERTPHVKAAGKKHEVSVSLESVATDNGTICHETSKQNLNVSPKDRIASNSAKTVSITKELKKSQVPCSTSVNKIRNSSSNHNSRKLHREKYNRIISESESSDAEGIDDLTMYKSKFMRDTKMEEKKRRNELMKNRKLPPKHFGIAKKTCFQSTRPFKEKEHLDDENYLPSISDVEAHKDVFSSCNRNEIAHSRDSPRPSQRAMRKENKQTSMEDKFCISGSHSSDVPSHIADVLVAGRSDSWGARRDGCKQIDTLSLNNRSASQVRARMLQQKMESIFGIDSESEDLPLSPDSYCSSTDLKNEIQRLSIGDKTLDNTLDDSLLYSDIIVGKLGAHRDGAHRDGAHRDGASATSLVAHVTPKHRLGRRYSSSNSSSSSSKKHHSLVSLGEVKKSSSSTSRKSELPTNQLSKDVCIVASIKTNQEKNVSLSHQQTVKTSKSVVHSALDSMPEYNEEDALQKFLTYSNDTRQMKETDFLDAIERGACIFMFIKTVNVFVVMKPTLM